METTPIIMPLIAVSTTASSFVFMTIASLALLWLIPHAHRHHLRKVGTYHHELCHGIASLATGGEFHKFHVHPNGNGLCVTSGGNKYITIAAGYVGVVLSGAVLLAQSINYLPAVVLLQIMTLLLAISTLKAGDLHTAAVGIIVSAALGMSSVLFPHAWMTRFLMNFLGVLLILQGFEALKVLLIVSATRENTGSDAEALGALTNKHPLFWALALSGIAVVVLLMVYRYIF